MSRLPTPASIEASPAASQPLLQAVKKQLGVVPNLFRLVGNSPAALEGYLGLNGALAKGALEAPTRERIALAVAEINGCDYCLSAHSYLGKNLAKLSDAEIAANRGGGSTDAKADAAVHFAVELVNARGHVSDGRCPGRQAGGLHRCAGDRDRAACRAEHARPTTSTKWRRPRSISRWLPPRPHEIAIAARLHSTACRVS